MLHSSAAAGVWQSGSCTRTLHCRNNQTAIRAPQSTIKTAAATGRASKPADQIKSSQIKRSKTSRAYPKYLDGELTYLSRSTILDPSSLRRKWHWGWNRFSVGQRGSFNTFSTLSGSFNPFFERHRPNFFVQRTNLAHRKARFWYFKVFLWEYNV